MGANTRRRNSQRPDRPSPRPNQLQLAEYICWVSSALGTLVASTSMQFAYAGVPLSLSLLLNLANRRRIEISTHQRTMNAVVRVQQQFTQDLVALNDRIQFIAQQHIPPGSTNASRSPLLTQSQQRLQQLQAAQANIHSQSQMRIRDLEDFKLIYQELVNLQEQHRQVYESLAATIDYLNDSPLPHRVDELEQEIQQLHRELHQMSEQLAQSLALTVAGQEAVAQRPGVSGAAVTVASANSSNLSGSGISGSGISAAVATFPQRPIVTPASAASADVVEAEAMTDRQFVQLEDNFPANEFLTNEFMQDATVTFLGREAIGSDAIEPTDIEHQGEFAPYPNIDLNIDPETESDRAITQTEITPDFDPALLAELDAALEGEFAAELDQVFIDDVAEDLTEGLFDQLTDSPPSALSVPAQPLPPHRPSQPLSLPLEVFSPSVQLPLATRSTNSSGAAAALPSAIDTSSAFVETAPISQPPLAPISFEVVPRTEPHGETAAPREAMEARPESQAIVAPLLPEVRSPHEAISFTTTEPPTIASTNPSISPSISPSIGDPAVGNIQATVTTADHNPIAAEPTKLRDWRCVQTLTDHGDWVSDLLIDPNGKVLVSASFDRTIQFWNLATGEMLSVLSDHASPVCAIALSAEQGWLVSGSWDRTVKIWDFSSQELLETLVDDSGIAGSVRSLAVSPNGRFVASGWFDRTIALWDVRVTPQRRRVTVNACGSHLGHEGRVDALAFSPDGELLASASADGTVKIWGIDSTDGSSTGSSTGDLSLLHTIAETADPINAIRFSQDGAQLIGANRNHTIYVWDVETATLQYQLMGHTGSVTSLAIHPDGSTLISGSADGTVWLWDLRTGNAIGMFSEITDAVMSVAVSADGRVVVSGSADGTIKVWRNFSLL